MSVKKGILVHGYSEIVLSMTRVCYLHGIGMRRKRDGIGMAVCTVTGRGKTSRKYSPFRAADGKRRVRAHVGESVVYSFVARGIFRRRLLIHRASQPRGGVETSHPSVFICMLGSTGILRGWLGSSVSRPDQIGESKRKVVKETQTHGSSNGERPWYQ